MRLVVGGWAGNRTLIRRRRQDLDLTVEYTFNVLRKDDPLKLLIEISNSMKRNYSWTIPIISMFLKTVFSCCRWYGQSIH